MPANDPSLRQTEPFDRQPGQTADAEPVTEHLPGPRLALLFVVSMVSATGNTAMQSVMPSIGTQLRVSDTAISLAFTLSALLWAVFAPYWARRSDQRGRKAMMPLGLAAFSIHFLLGGFVLWLGLAGLIGGMIALVIFAVVRLLNGALGSATSSAVQAYVASRSAPADRTRVLALIASSMGLGTVIGPGLAPLLVLPVVGLAGPFIAFALFGFVTLAALRLYLPHDRPAFAGHGDIAPPPLMPRSAMPETGEPEDEPAPPPESKPPRLRWADPRVRGWTGAGACGGVAQVALISITGFLVLDRLGLRGDPHAGAAPVGLVMMCGAFATLLAQWGLIPMLRPGPRTAVISGMALAALGLTIWALAQDLHTIALGYSIASLGFGLHRPGFTSGASLAVSRREQGQVAGMVSSLFGAVYVAAPLTVWLYNTHPATIYLALPVLCLAAALAPSFGTRLAPAA
ncbi:MAG: MFS transporter [Sphingomonadales bacterium]|nr:MFS transporter [Sphingomonadales bacterium]